VSSVFVIVNEWTDITGNSGAEVVGSNFFRTEQEAWDSLLIIAQTFEAELLPADTSIQLEDHTPNLQFEEYYIQELTEL
jgi:hypothetical protein